MKLFRPLLVALLAFLTAVPAAPAATVSLRLVNPNQRDGVYAVILTAADAPAGNVAFRVGGKLYPADRLAPDRLAALVPLPSLGAATLEIVPGPPVTPMPVRQEEGRIVVATDCGSVTFDEAAGLAAVTIGGRTIPVRLDGTAGRHTVQAAGVNLVEIIGPERRYEVWRTGRLRILSPTPLTFGRPAAGAEIFLRKHGYGYRCVPITGPSAWIVRDFGGVTSQIAAPVEWAQFYDTSRRVGYWLHHTSLTATGRIDKARGTITYPVHPPGNAIALDLVPIAALEDGAAAYERSHPVLMFREDRAPIASGPGGVDTIVARDRNGDGIDLRSDTFTFLRGTSVVSVIEFHPTWFLVTFGGDTNRPAALFEDWNRDGRFFDGPLFWGGFLEQDQLYHSAPAPGVGDVSVDTVLGRSWDALVRAFDLDGDGDSDVLQDRTMFYFDLEDRPIGYGLRFDPAAGKLVGEMPAWMVQQRGTGVSWGSGGRQRMYRGHYVLEGESQLSFNFDESTRAPEAKLRMTGVNWGNRRDLGALRWNRFCLANLDGKTDEQLNGHYNWDIQFQTGREIQDYNDTGDCFRYGNLFTLRDAWGHELPLRIWEVPPNWDGKKLTWGYRPEARTHELHAHAPWHGITIHWYPKLLGIFEAEDVLGEPADEGMEPWALSYGLARRWEVRLTPKPHGEPITIYYSPLMGAFHFKGAAFSHVNAPPSWSGTALDWAQKQKLRDNPILPFTVAHLLNGDLYADPYRLRIWGGLFLCAWDTDRDQYFDTYLYDETNDGVIDRVLAYDHVRGIIELLHPAGLTAWPQRIVFDDYPFLLENHAKIGARYREGYQHEPMVAAVNLDANGRPAYESVAAPVYIALGRDWLPRVAVDRYHAGESGYDWTDFSAGGLLRLGGEFSQRRFILGTLDEHYTPERLRGLDVLVIARFDRMLTGAERTALETWLAAGGRLLVLNASEREDERRLLNHLTAPFGIRFGDGWIENRTERWRQPHYGDDTWRDMRHPVAANRVQRYASPLPGFLRDVRYLSFVGAPLAVSGNARPVLAWDGHTVVAESDVGRGLVLVCGAGFCLNKYLCHPTDNEGSYTENRLILERIADRMAAGASPPRVTRFETRRGGYCVELTGRGGAVRLPVAGERAVLAMNGQPAAGPWRPPVATVQLPAGKTTLEVRP